MVARCCCNVPLLTSKVFGKIFDTFHGDTVSKAKITKRAKELNVHPESADECAQLFIDSALAAGIGTMSGDLISLINAGSAVPLSVEPAVGQGEGRSRSLETMRLKPTGQRK